MMQKFRPIRIVQKKNKLLVAEGYMQITESKLAERNENSQWLGGKLGLFAFLEIFWRCIRF